VITTALTDGAPPRSFDDVYRRDYDPLVRALTAACGDREVAADCVQEAFVRAHLRWRRVAAYDDPAGWVRRVAINKMRDHFRHESKGDRVRRLLAASTPAHQPGPEPSTDLAAVFATLTTQQRIAISLYYVAQLSVIETAAAMRISDGAVKFHLHEGRRRLRPLIEQGSDHG
jgi:RNA polymerase sigma-70 factor (ECF subfamily)